MYTRTVLDEGEQKMVTYLERGERTSERCHQINLIEHPQWLHGPERATLFCVPSMNCLEGNESAPIKFDSDRACFQPSDMPQNTQTTIQRGVFGWGPDSNHRDNAVREEVA